MRYFSAQSEGESFESLLCLLEILCRRGRNGVFSEEFASAGGKGDFYITKRVQILIVEGAGAFRFDGLKPTFLGEGPELLGVRPIHDRFDDLLPALHCEGATGSHFIPWIIIYNRKLA
jgi:hypothetical protein